MILDMLRVATRYAGMHPQFAAAFAFLERPDLMTLDPGRYDIGGTALYAIVSKGEGKSADEVRLEAHRRYIDIHAILTGEEMQGWRPTSDCRAEEQPYDPEKDFQLFGDDPAVWVSVHPGLFSVYYPEDAHAPMVAAGSVHKVVIKVAV